METGVGRARRTLRGFVAGAAVILVGVVGLIVAPVAAQAAVQRVAVVDQRSGIKVFNLAATRWNPKAPVWFWPRPAGDSGWSNLSDVKFRKSGKKNVVLVTASGGRAGVIDASTKQLIWTATPGGNPHAIELLRNGVIVVASSTANRLTVYGKGSTSGRTYTLKHAHAVLWDPGTSRLWAYGANRLCSYHVGGSASAPVLNQRTCRSTAPSGGHDLAPIYGTTTGLWLSATKHVHTYDINTNALRQAPGYIDNPSIKSVGNFPGGPVVTTKVTGANADGTYGNGRVWLYNQNGSYIGSRNVAGAAIYKARPLVWGYR